MKPYYTFSLFLGILYIFNRCEKNPKGIYVDNGVLIEQPAVMIFFPTIPIPITVRLTPKIILRAEVHIIIHWLIVIIYTDRS